MRILVACEYSGRVRDAFRAEGHDAVSCDILPTEAPGPHIQGDVLDQLGRGWDMLIAFPPCTHLCVSGARWWPQKREDGRQQAAIEFFMKIATCPIPRKAIENPIGIMSSHWRKPDQIVQPWQFGHPESKATCLWLERLPPLMFTGIIRSGVESRIHRMPPGPDRAKKRSLTYQGIADAMGRQWGGLAPVGNP